MKKTNAVFSIQGIVKDYYLSKNKQFLTIVIETENQRFYIRALPQTMFFPKFEDFKKDCKIDTDGHIERFKYSVINLIADVIRIKKEF